MARGWTHIAGCAPTLPRSDRTTGLAPEQRLYLMQLDVKEERARGSR
jgi:hypothetical protein